MMIVLLLLVLVPAGLAALAGLRLVVADGLGLRPPPSVHAEQERMRTWPR